MKNKEKLNRPHFLLSRFRKYFWHSTPYAYGDNANCDGDVDDKILMKMVILTVVIASVMGVDLICLLCTCSFDDIVVQSAVKSTIQEQINNKCINPIPQIIRGM